MKLFQVMQLCNIYQSLQQIHDKEELEDSGKRLSPRTMQSCS